MHKISCTKSAPHIMTDRAGKYSTTAVNIHKLKLHKFNNSFEKY